MGVRGLEDVNACHACALQPPSKPWDLSQWGVHILDQEEKQFLNVLSKSNHPCHNWAGSTGWQQAVQSTQVYFFRSAQVAQKPQCKFWGCTWLWWLLTQTECLQDLCSFRSELVILVRAGLPDKKRWFTWMGGELQFFCNEFIINTVRDKTRQFQIHKSSVFLLISVFFGTPSAVSIPLERLFHNTQ